MVGTKSFQENRRRRDKKRNYKLNYRNLYWVKVLCFYDLYYIMSLYKQLKFRPKTIKCKI